MLYDKRWDIKTDILSNASLVAWLEKKPPEKTYNYTTTFGCLLTEYFRSRGFLDVWIPNDEVWHESFGPQRDLPKGWGEVAKAFPHTYGAAAERARKLVGD